MFSIKIMIIYIIHLISAVANRLSDKPTNYLKNMYFDAISYNSIALQGLVNLVGSDRIMFGTDNPFFPPVGVAADKVTSASWPSTLKVQQCISELSDKHQQKHIQFENAQRLFGL